jgi:hypothetical protein
MTARKKRLQKTKKTMITMGMNMAAAVIKMLKMRKTKIMDTEKNKLMKKMQKKKKAMRKSK